MTPESKLLEWSYNQGPLIFVLSVVIWSLLTKRLAPGYIVIDLENRLTKSEEKHEKQLQTQREEYDKQIEEIREGHEIRCRDYEARLEKKDREALEWRNLTLNLGGVAAKSASVAEKAVTTFVAESG